jgi:hypothetical protein
MVEPDPPTAVDEAGLWKWELEYVMEGVVDIVWELQPPAKTPEKSQLEQLHG